MVASVQVDRSIITSIFVLQRHILSWSIVLVVVHCSCRGPLFLSWSIVLVVGVLVRVECSASFPLGAIEPCTELLPEEV